MDSNLDRYLKKLGVTKRSPSLEALTEIIVACHSHFPFENISKIHYHQSTGLKDVPDFNTYLDRADNYNFGGTCYTNNYYLGMLLEWLDYDVILCGADIYAPDVHMVNIVTLEGKRYLVDVGYAAPFLFPIPLDNAETLEIKQGKDKYLLLPRNGNDVHEMQFFRGVAYVHGYRLKPRPRQFSEFKRVIENSYGSSSTFFKDLLISKYIDGYWYRLHNRTFTRAAEDKFFKHRLNSIDEIAEKVETVFGMPESIVMEVLKTLPNLLG